MADEAAVVTPPPSPGGAVEEKETTAEPPSSVEGTAAASASVADDTAAAAVVVEDEEEAAAAPSHAFRGLTVLPPKQLRHQQQLQQNQPRLNIDYDDAAIALPLIRAEEPTASIRAALSELVGLAHITNYRLELEPTDGSGENKQEGGDPLWHENHTKWDPPLVSPYTGPEAVVTVPAGIKVLDEGNIPSLASKRVLDDWGDLHPLVAHGLQDGSAFRIILHRYDVASLKDHVTRLRTLLNGNAPSLLALVDDHEAPPPTEGPPSAEGENNTAAVASNVDAGEGNGESKDDAGETAAPPPKPLPSLPEFTTAPDGSNLCDFYYLASGEDPKLYLGKPDASKSNKKKKKAKGAHASSNGQDDTAAPELSVEQEIREKLPRLNELDQLTRVDCQLEWSSFHPPPSHRKLIGDLGYLVLYLPGDAPAVHVTATPMGFYVNRSSLGGSAQVQNRPHFDPSPAAEPCFSHALLDCLLQASPVFKESWSAALEASRERAEITTALNHVTPFLSLFRFAIRADFKGFSSPESAAAVLQTLDSSFQTPSWLVPHPRHESYTADDLGRPSNPATWNRNHYHGSDPIRTEEELVHNFGIDVRSGGIRDWNEELQLGREMPTDTQHDRIEKARLIHKVMTEFAEAVLYGVKAISEGQIQPMNPNETIRTQVYLHNNIFFSRAIDAGPETFKLAKGDRAARKTANRELHCNSVFHRLERPGFHTLANVLVDYLGTRYVCQSVLPGILIGDHGHKVLLGAVENGVPLKWDSDLHELLEQKVAKTMMVATRPVLRNPLTRERLDEIERLKSQLPALPPEPGKPELPDMEAADPAAVMTTCLPLEAKAIQGSDNRKYVLDLGRLSPRDANWLPLQKGGTGKWEALRRESGKSGTAIPSSLDDDEWTMCVLRHELVTRFTQYSMAKFVREFHEKNSDGGVDEESIFQSKEGKDFLSSLRLNVNVFLPDVKTFEGIDEDLAEQVRRDEQRVCAAATYLWDEVLPKVTKVIKDSQVHQLPVDGRTLTELLHRQGINCRYLGRLAVLAQHEEEKDAKVDEDLKHGRLTVLDGRHTMPKCWLELLEIEMIARAAKHVLDAYLIEGGGVVAAQPAQTVASFLSAIVSEAEETAAQTETRLEKRPANEPDDDDFAALTISGIGGDGDALSSPIRSRHEVWQDIELEIGRRFRYTLTLFNTGNKAGRARHIPLLRRVCQRTGVRLLAKNYDVGGRCLCSGGASFGGKLCASYPISPLDIHDIVPLMKHTAAYNEGFYPCSLSPAATIPPLQVLLQDARAAMEAAHVHTSQRALGKGLELAQEALALYQRVTENPSHPGVIESMELMASIFHDADDYGMAVLHAEKALSLVIQTGGFDTSNVVNAHLTLSQMLFAMRELERAVKHLRAAIYLLDLMAGPMHTEAFTAYHKLGNAYSEREYNGRYLPSAVKCFKEAAKRDSFDRLMEGITSKHVARALAAMGEYKEAVAAEKVASTSLGMFLGRDHKWVKECEEELDNYTKLAVAKGNKTVESAKMKQEVARADAIAAELIAAVEDTSKVKHKTKKKKGKK